MLVDHPPICEAERAFGVVFGPSIVLDGVGGAAIASAVHALRRHHRPSRAVALASGLVGAYLTVGRPLMLHWGATCEELQKPLPGDELVPDPAVQSTRGHDRRAARRRLAVARAARAGPRRLLQLRGLENLAGCEMDNADEIHSEWQTRELGETVSLHPLRGLPVARGRVPRGPGALTNGLLLEVPHFVMERKMLLGIKERAERCHTAAVRRVAQAAPVAEAVHV